MGCIFCDLSVTKKDEIVLENEHFFSIYDDNPISEGHSLIIPKEHVDSFFKLSPEQVNNMYELLGKMKNAVDERFNPDGYNIGINEGRDAGQTVSHLHIHLIPRYRGDVENPTGGVRHIFPEKADYTKKSKK